MLDLDHEKRPLHKEVLKEQNRVNANNYGLGKNQHLHSNIKNKVCHKLLYQGRKTIIRQFY